MTSMIKVTQKEETRVVKIQECSLDPDFVGELVVMLLQGEAVVTEVSKDYEAPELSYAGHLQARMGGIHTETVTLSMPQGITMEIKRESLK